MIIRTKCQYALRAVYEIARSGQGLMTISDVAKAQRIPQRYLEGILNQLQKGGILEAQRGRSGGYKLARIPAQITVGEVVRLIDGPIRVVACVEEKKTMDCPMRNNCVFLPTWDKVQTAIDQALDSTTYDQLLKLEKESASKVMSNFVI